MMNHLHNAQFRPGPDDSLLYFTHEGNVRWQDPATQGYHACVMSHTRRNRNTQLNYALPIWVKDRSELHLSAWMRANRRVPVQIRLRYQKQNGRLVKEEQISLIAGPDWQWKYHSRPIPAGAEQLRLSLHLASAATLQLRGPRVFFWW